MSQSLPFLIIGLLLLILLVVWARRGARPAPSGGELAGAQTALTILQSELLPQALVERIFALQDWDFVRSQAPADVQGVFLRERKAIALSWLRQTRRQVKKLMEFHLLAARRSVNLSPAMEVKVATDCLLFLLECGILIFLIRLRGPFYVRRMVGQTASVAERLCVISQRLLESMAPARLAGGKTNLPERSAAV